MSQNDELIIELAGFAHDPLAFVMWAFPWGEAGSELENYDGPELWQKELLCQLRDGLITYTQAIQQARTSGHGIGKSGFVAWLILWGMSTYEDTIGVVTANTENQLKTKTWVQVAKWYRMFLARDLFKLTKTALFSVDPEHAETWRFDMVPWSERNTEAFAGLHNQGKRIIVIFDEASAIPDIIWEVTEGALTDENTEIIWAVFGNPTRNTGRFRECFEGGRFAHRWTTAAVDSREVSLTNKEQIARWIEDYGPDHDFVRVRVLGKFPRTDATSFISLSIAREASVRVVEPQNGHPIILGVDVGRFGDDPSVIYPRRGRDARTFPVEVYLGLDLMDLAARVAAAFLHHRATVVMVDGGGVGGGVVDRLRQLRIPVMDIDFGSKPDGTNVIETGIKYANKRAEIWGGLRDWLPGASIHDIVAGSETTLVDELVGPQYGLNAREEIILESKKDMRRRGIPSPNLADALALTFAHPSYETVQIPIEDMGEPVMVPDYNPYERERIYD